MILDPKSLPMLLLDADMESESQLLGPGEDQLLERPCDDQKATRCVLPLWLAESEGTVGLVEYGSPGPWRISIFSGGGWIRGRMWVGRHRL